MIPSLRGWPSKPVGDFLQWYLADHPNDTWAQIKAELTLRFSETVDAGHVMSLLRCIKLNSSETVHLFAERMLDLGKDAFPGQDLTDLTIGRQLVEIFVDGLKSSTITRKILRENPQTLQAAVTTASTEYNLFQKFRLRHREDTPMEIGVVEGKKAEWVEKNPPKFEGKCFNCDKYGHRKVNCRLPKKMFRGTCRNCGKFGHMAKDCRLP